MFFKASLVRSLCAGPHLRPDPFTGSRVGQAVQGSAKGQRALPRGSRNLLEHGRGALLCPGHGSVLPKAETARSRPEAGREANTTGFTGSVTYSERWSPVSSGRRVVWLFRHTRTCGLGRFWGRGQAPQGPEGSVASREEWTDR